MPCKDITEVIRVVVDDADRLSEYQFSKRTCGQGVGVESLLIDQFQGARVDKLLAYDAARFLADHPIEDELEEFLALKHLFAVQSALEVLTGKQPGGKDDPCAAAEIEYGDGQVIITAHIAVDLVTERIKACGNCRLCGKKNTQ